MSNVEYDETPGLDPRSLMREHPPMPVHGHHPAESLGGNAHKLSAPVRMGLSPAAVAAGQKTIVVDGATRYYS